jgi:tetratricopeptide (TPR) repeat protein
MVIQGQPSEAIAVYQQAIRQNPKNALAYYNLGVTLYNQGHMKQANSALKRAHKEYQDQNNLAQTDKIEQLMLQIAQKTAPKQAQASQPSTPSQAATTRTILFKQTEPQQPNQPEVPQATQGDPGYVPILEPQPTSMSPR